MKYQILIDAHYVSWSFQDENSKKITPEVISTFNPFADKLFTRDMIEIDGTGTPRMIHSHIRNVKEIAGVLILDENKTYGRDKKKGRLLYKCIPDDKYLPSFLIPYEVSMGFSKKMKNKYVVFQFQHWNDKHPQGQLVHVLGDVDNLEVFYEYQLFCRSLHISLVDFTNKTRDMLSRKSHEEYIDSIMQNPDFIIHDRRGLDYIFTIDPNGSTDYDDGFSFQVTPDGSKKVSVYIANVFFWLETLHLWPSFTKRISTIYLPDRRRPMLPTILSDTLCSLQENRDRFSFIMDLTFDASGNIVHDSVKFTNALIRVSKNYVYEESDLLDNATYKDFFAFTRSLDRTVNTSHDIVAFWMIMMNKICAEHMMNDKYGIFRSAAFLNSNQNIGLPETLSEDIKRTIKAWNNVNGQYVLYNDNMEDCSHELMNLKSYVHITSPIRRLVDLLNQIGMMLHKGMVKKISNESCLFINGWNRDIEYINATMRSIRKVQNNCDLMHKCFNDDSLMNIEHSGVVFDKIEKEGGIYTYMVYLEKLKLMTKIRTMENLENYSIHQFKLYLFENENKVVKKIRVALVSQLSA